MVVVVVVVLVRGSVVVEVEVEVVVGVVVVDVEVVGVVVEVVVGVVDVVDGVVDVVVTVVVVGVVVVVEVVVVVIISMLDVFTFIYKSKFATPPLENPVHLQNSTYYFYDKILFQLKLTKLEILSNRWRSFKKQNFYFEFCTLCLIMFEQPPDLASKDK